MVLNTWTLLGWRLKDMVRSEWRQDEELMWLTNWYKLLENTCSGEKSLENDCRSIWCSTYFSMNLCNWQQHKISYLSLHNTILCFIVFHIDYKNQRFNCILLYINKISFSYQILLFYFSIQNTAIIIQDDFVHTFSHKVILQCELLNTGL